MPRSLSYPWSWGLVCLITLLLQLSVPIAGDEAYFVSWGNAPQLVYYDHPPLPGWISYLIRELGSVLGISQHGVIHRVFAILLGGGGLWLLARRLRALAPETGSEQWLIALALVPGMLILFNLYLNDTLLAFLVLIFLLSTEAALRAVTRAWVPVLLAGLSFAAVLLTKYNGAVIYLGVVLALVTWPRHWRFLVGRMALISIIALGPFLLHLWWNYNQCSVNLAFNFGFRSSGATGYGPLWLALALMIMAGPLGYLTLVRMWKSRHEPERFGFFTRVFLASLAIMLAIAILRRDFGANWGAPLGFMALLALAEVVPGRALVWARRAGVVFASFTLIPLALVLLMLKLGVLDGADITNPKREHTIDLYLDLDDGSLIKVLHPLAKVRVVAAMEYGVGGSLGNSGFDDVTVLSRSVYGRNQDIATDFTALNGYNMLVLPNGQVADPDLAARLFDSFEIRTVKTDRRQYQVILGDGFLYETFREDWILPVMTELYDKSPFPYGGCSMEKYR